MPTIAPALSRSLLMRLMRDLGRRVVTIFALWHMFAVAAYSVPVDTKDAFSLLDRAYIVPIVRPYLFWTSQWQQWNLFSPNPLRRVTQYRIDWRISDIGYSLRFAPDTIPFMRDADELKILRRMEDSGEAWKKLRERYLVLLCRAYDIPVGTAVRLTFEYYVIPQHNSPAPTAFWKEWHPEWLRTPGAEILCPDPHA